MLANKDNSCSSFKYVQLTVCIHFTVSNNVDFISTGEAE